MKFAIMFADITGSTQLYDELGDAVAADCVNQCLQRMMEITNQHAGTIINTIGDEIFCRFVHAADAIRAASMIQEVFSSAAVNSYNIMISLRIGIHYGEIVSREADIFGDAVNIAARVARIATARQILTTEQTVLMLTPEFAQKTRQFDRIELKGKPQPLTLFEFVWEERDITIMRNDTTGFQVNSRCLHLMYQGVKQTVQPNSPPFVIGRNDKNELTVNAHLVSRVHAYCTYRRGKFILIDQSTNGTFVHVNQGPEIYLRREELPLVGRGLIGFGESTNTDNGQIVQFACL